MQQVLNFALKGAQKCSSDWNLADDTCKCNTTSKAQWVPWVISTPGAVKLISQYGTEVQRACLLIWTRYWSWRFFALWFDENLSSSNSHYDIGNTLQHERCPSRLNSLWLIVLTNNKIPKLPLCNPNFLVESIFEGRDMYGQGGRMVRPRRRSLRL